VAQEKNGEDMFDRSCGKVKYYLELRRRGTSYILEKKRNANWIGRILRRKCLLKHTIEGNTEGIIEVTGRRRRRKRRKQLVADLKETRRYCKLKQEELYRTIVRFRFGRGYGPVERQTAE
jgi:hypothetical protein